MVFAPEPKKILIISDRDFPVMVEVQIIAEPPIITAPPIVAIHIESGRFIIIPFYSLSHLTFSIIFLLTRARVDKYDGCFG